MSRHDTGTKAFSFERVVWEIREHFIPLKIARFLPCC